MVSLFFFIIDTALYKIPKQDTYASLQNVQEVQNDVLFFFFSQTKVCHLKYNTNMIPVVLQVLAVLIHKHQNYDYMLLEMLNVVHLSLKQF